MKRKKDIIIKKVAKIAKRDMDMAKRITIIKKIINRMIPKTSIKINKEVITTNTIKMITKNDKI